MTSAALTCLSPALGLSPPRSLLDPGSEMTQTVQPRHPMHVCQLGWTPGRGPPQVLQPP